MRAVFIVLNFPSYTGEVAHSPESLRVDAFDLKECNSFLSDPEFHDDSRLIDGRYMTSLVDQIEKTTAGFGIPAHVVLTCEEREVEK